MKKRVLVVCVLLGAALGAIAGSGASSERTAAHDDVTRSAELRASVARMQTRFADVKRDLDAASTYAAATAARAKLFQLRVDMVALEDEIAVLARRRGVAREF